MGGEPGAGGVPAPEGETIGEHVARTCFTDGDDTPRALLDGLSHQLVDAIDCVRPGTLGDLPPGNWVMLDPARRPLVDARGVDDLLDAAAAGPGQLVIKWAYRDVAIQHLFYLWTLKGCDFAAPPGLSNHQNGLSVDLVDPEDWAATMRRFGWENNLPTDRPHFDYVLAEDEGTAALSLFAFQALWNRNRPDHPIPLTGEFDAATEQALTDAPLTGFREGLCDPGGPPIELPPLRGPSVAQAAWRGCDAPIPLIEGLSAQVAEVMRCADAAAVVPLNLCAGAGCLTVAAPPKPEWLEADTHAALVRASQRVGRSLSVLWAGRDPTLTWFLYSAQRNLSCPGDTAAPGASAYVTGRAVQIVGDDDPAVAAALEAEGFQRIDEGGGWLYPAGADLRPLAVYAFQALWNANRPDDPLDADGRLGPATQSALDRAPTAGFPNVPCAGLNPPDGPAGPGFSCVDGCVNQACPGAYDFCTEQHGECAAVPCGGDADCDGLAVCDDPGRGSSPLFFCDAGRCRRQR